MAEGTWVATFNGQVARVFEADAAERLHHLPAEGMDSRSSRDEQPDRLDLPPVGDENNPVTEDQFVARFAERLAARAQNGAFIRLVVAAAPKALANFRQHAPASLQPLIAAELPKDHVHTPVKQLEAALSEQLRV